MSSLNESPAPGQLRGCAECGATVDTLRAARVRLIDEAFLYFCSSRCADAYTPHDDGGFESERREGPTGRIPTPVSWTSGDPPPPRVGSTTTRPPEASPSPRDAEPNAVSTSGSTGATARPAAVQTAAEDAAHRGPAPFDAQRLLAVAISLGLLTIGLLLAAESELTRYLRVTTTSLGTAALVGFWLAFERRGTRRFSAVPSTLSLLALLFVPLAWLLEPDRVDSVINFASTYLVAGASTALLLHRLFRGVDEQRAELRAWLNQPARRVSGDQLESIDIDALRPGEEIVVHAGETVVADVTVVAGRAEVYPWFGAETIARVSPEDFVYAGARLASGQIRAIVRWTGRDRHWERLTNDPVRRVDHTSPFVLTSLKLARRGAPVLVLVALLAGPVTQFSPTQWALTVLASLGALLSPALHQLEALRVTQSVLAALRHGIVYRSAEALDAAGRASTAVFCARGTLLLGEPELSSIDAWGQLDTNAILGLAAGAEQTQRHPTAIALMRAARARGLTPDAVRSPRHEQGLGVTAIASNGKPLVVGSRALLLRERVSVARAEARITELEAMGRTVVLVAVGGHLAGILALQDGLRAGSRAAVQHLLDAGIEPVLLSGDARKSCESLGRTIDIEHLRPEILPADRGREVQRLKSGGAQVAVIGRSPNDDVALTAASVSVALPTPGTPNMDYDVELATEEVQKAALALRLAHQSRRRAVTILLIGFGGGIASVLAVVALSAPLAFIPLACLGFTVAAAASLSTAHYGSGS